MGKELRAALLFPLFRGVVSSPQYCLSVNMHIKRQAASAPIRARVVRKHLDLA